MNDTTTQNEEGLIASVIVSSKVMDDVSGIVQDRDFLDPLNRSFWRAIQIMRENKIPTDDLAILSRHLKTTGMPMQEIARLLGSGVAANAIHYARAVSEGGRRRRLAAGLLEALNEIQRDNGSLDAAIVTAEETIEAERATAETSAVHISGAGGELVAHLKDKPTETICMSGLWSVDDKVGGFMGGETVVIAARPGIGKTSLAMQVGVHNAQKGRNGLFISLEMTRRELVGRVLCGMADVDSKRLRTGEITMGEINRIEVATGRLSSLGCWIWDPPRATMAQIASTAKLALLRHGIRWLVVDYIGLISTGGRRADRREHIGHCSRSLKELAKELKIPVFVMAQLNREAAASEPGLEHLKESGDIEQDADVVMFIHKEQSKTTRLDEHSLIVAKHRHGRTGKLAITFNGASTTFIDPSQAAAESNVYGDTGVDVSGTRWVV